MIIDEFTRMLARHPDSIQNDRSFQSYIHDYFPQEPKMAKELIKLFHLGIANGINKAEVLDDQFYGRYVAELVKKCGTESSLARKAVNIWCSAYGRNILDKKYNSKYGARAYEEVPQDDIDKSATIASFKVQQNKPDGSQKVYIDTGKMDISSKPVPAYSISANAYNTPILDQYKKALCDEMNYLKDIGGHEYRVSNGKFINITHGMFSYNFEMESEVFLSEDTPVTIKMSGGNKVSGTVLVCENFQIIVLLDKDLGKAVGNAWISADPWKLLEALHDKIENLSKENKIAVEILEDGPKLATKEPPENIPKGQKIAEAMGLKNDVTVIWGPPGTGKTYTMARIAIRAMEQKKSVLIVSHSNISVDGVVKAVSEQLRNDGKDAWLKAGRVLRYGYVRDEQLSKDNEAVAFNYALQLRQDLKTRMENAQAEKNRLKNSASPLSSDRTRVEQELKNIRIQIREDEKRYAEHADVVATTISKVTIDKLFNDKKYDLVMFDEVSMAYVPQIVCAASYAKQHFICVGDFRQLSPIAQSKAKDVLEKDIFSYLQISGIGSRIYAHPWLVMLDEQRRMHPSIAAFPNRFVYRRLLKNHKSVQTCRNAIVQGKPMSGHPVSIINLKGTYCAAAKNSENSRFNILSAIVSFATALDAEKNGEKSIGIITPYAAQARLVRAMIQDQRKYEYTDVACSTVHQFQGSERNVIVFDAVESFPEHDVGFLMSKNENSSVTRLINVAVTRARGKFIAVANGLFWKNNFEGKDNIFYQLVCYISENENVVGVKDKILQDYFSAVYMGKNIMYYPELSDALEDLENDIGKARNKIVISIPDGQLDNEYGHYVLQMLLKAKQNKIQILCKSNAYNDLPEEWKKITWRAENAVFPVMLVDDRVIWYGLPVSRGLFTYKSNGYNTVCQTILRIVGEHTIGMIKSLSDLEQLKIGGIEKPLLEKMETDYQSSKSTDPDDDGDDVKQEEGLGKFVENYVKCSKCESPMKLAKGRRGNCYLRCSSCKNMEYLTPDITNQYIERENVMCPIHHCKIHAKLGKYGIFIKCDQGHFMKPDEI